MDISCHHRRRRESFSLRAHDEQQIEQARQGRLPAEVAYIPGENELLQGLADANRDLIEAIGVRCPSQKIATIDQDATIIESHKREAERTYEGKWGYQPMLAVWAEMDLIVADQFRDGNVPAVMAPLAGLSELIVGAGLLAGSSVAMSLPPA